MTTLTSHTHAQQWPASRLAVPGAIGGLLGGMAMAMFSMLVAISRDGFWAPVRGITSVVFGDEHYGGGFDFWTVAVGAAGHMMNSVVLGALFALMAGLVLTRASSVATWMAGAVYGLAVWAVMVLIVAGGLQSSDLFADSVPHWAWIAGHLMFGAITAMVVTALQRRSA
ncbi:MAG: hypothetical protein AB7J35_05475 [Dehalococcoidia bacterium]